MLDFAAANDVFGASLYEPCGQIDQIRNLFGATATNRNTGGYCDKITELELQADGLPENGGNGVLFLDYNVDGLWYGLSRSVAFRWRPPGIREERKHDHHPLRVAVEEKLTQSSSTIPDRKEKNPEALIHKSQVHQVELEVQNEKLRRARGLLLILPHQSNVLSIEP